MLFKILWHAETFHICDRTHYDQEQNVGSDFAAASSSSCSLRIQVVSVGMDLALWPKKEAASGSESNYGSSTNSIAVAGRSSGCQAPQLNRPLTLIPASNLRRRPLHILHTESGANDASDGFCFSSQPYLICFIKCGVGTEWHACLVLACTASNQVDAIHPCESCDRCATRVSSANWPDCLTQSALGSPSDRGVSGRSRAELSDEIQAT